MTQIPAVDFSKEDCLKPGTSSWLSACKDVCLALEEFGCFTAILPNKVPSELSNTIFGTFKELFNFPMEIKAQTLKEKPVVDGHFISGNAAFESFTFGTHTEKIRKFADHFWPNGNDQFRESIDLYAKVMAELNEVVTRMVFENYDAQKYYDDHIQSSTISNFRFIKYTQPNEIGTEAGFRPHTDKTFNTILHQNHVNGLEINTKDDDWIGFDPPPSSFLFLAGDGFEVWSNGRIPSCKHRVIMGENELRYSVGVFFFKEGVIHTPTELIDEDHPIQYKPLHLLEYFQNYLKNLSTVGVDYTVKQYCGV